jgi:hypothetical protein
LGKRLLKAIHRIKNRQFGVRISEPSALALAISTLADVYGTSDISLLSKTKIPLPNASLKPKLESIFQEQPDCYYIFIFDICGYVCVICVTSHGRIKFLHTLTLDYMGFNFSESFLGLPHTSNKLPLLF